MDPITRFKERLLNRFCVPVILIALFFSYAVNQYRCAFANASTVLPGDANRDGTVDSADASTVLMSDALMISRDKFDADAGDVDKNGAVDTYDAAIILKIDAGKTAVSQYNDAEYMTASDLAKRITVGWDLAYWQENTDRFPFVLKMLKEKGFNAVKFPIDWISNMAEDDRIIDTVAGKVTKLTDFAVENGFFVILGFYGNGLPGFAINTANRDGLLRNVKRVSKELCRIFGGYDNRVSFEFLNEPQDITSESKWEVTADRLLLYGEAVRTFVGEVRSSGGYNRTRNLLITSYGNVRYENAVNSWLPDNDGHIAVAIHSYAPFQLAHEKNDVTDWYADLDSNRSSVSEPLKNAYDAFVSKGYPVFVTEFASRDKSNTQGRAALAKYYISVACGYGIKCFWWDTGKLSGNTFALIDRVNGEWLFPEVADALTNAASGADTDTVFYIGVPAVMTEGEKYDLSALVRWINGKDVSIGFETDSDCAEITGSVLTVKKAGTFTLNITGAEIPPLKIYVKPANGKHDFSLRYVTVSGKQQLAPSGGAPSGSRLDYDWFTSDGSVVSVSVYSTMSAFFDGEAVIYAFHKITGKYGFAVIKTKDGTVVEVNGAQV